MKACFKCGDTKPMMDFYRHPCMADGHQNKCKECTKADVRANRLKRLEYYRAYDRARGNRQPEGYTAKYYAENREKALAARKAWRKANQDKQQASSAVRNAIRDGKLSRPEACWHCGNSPPLHAHHASYAEDMRFAVTWLCRECHGAAHALGNEIMRQQA